MTSKPLFTTPHNKAFKELGARRPVTQWCAFDVPKEQAEAGGAKVFVMAIWDGVPKDKAPPRRVMSDPPDAVAGAYWYRVPRHGEGQAPQRAAQWDAIRIAREKGVRMLGVLKDSERSKWCSLAHVFTIADVRIDEKDEMAWLYLLPREGQNPRRLAPSDAAVPQASRTRKVPAAQYMSACAIAGEVYDKLLTRPAALAHLTQSVGLNRGTASSLINNYGCLVDGRTFKAPMSAEAVDHFVREIARTRDKASLGAMEKALKGYIDYVSGRAQAERALKMRLILQWLKRQQAVRPARLATFSNEVTRMIEAMAKTFSPDQQSEVLRQIWARGPQHAEFKRLLHLRWGNACSVHGVRCNGQLRASHIVPWSECESDAQKGDVNNGLLLSVPIDNLFDRGLISFSDEGKILFSACLSKETRRHFGIRDGMEIQWKPLDAQAKARLKENLAMHRERHRHQHGYA
jgi:hypothetical protein